MPVEDSRTEAVFFEALEKSSPDERATFLREACAGNDQLRQHVQRLLDAHPKVGNFLRGDDGNRFETIDASISEGPGTRIGPYKLMQQIGEGGFGVVFMAEQTEPMRRRVALKIIKPGMDSKSVIARFEAERQALALMDHPHIAKVLDAGTTESGRPYFVMDLVKGVPITQYCDEHKLTPTERLKLFIPVCHAIQHAHQKGIIHRDLKPSNVLVALYDGHPVPKVIDFGVAKATGVKLTERTLFTEYGAVVGTLEYMSPEQAELNQIDVDTRSDVYALGAMLYKLLTGRTPFERKQLVVSGFLDALQTIREEEPLLPSTRLTSSDDLPMVAASRGLEAKGLTGAVRGELDWIVMRCLEKDRNRRYETANSLAQDLQRYLDGDPVLAGPPSPTYRFRKFVLRYKAAAATAVTVAVLLVVTVVGLSIATLVTLRANSDTQQALDREQRTSYFQRIALIERELATGNLQRAEELLEQCPPELRGWEWRYLTRQLHGVAPTVISRAKDGIVACAVSPDGRMIAGGDVDGFVNLWDTETGRQIQRLVSGEEGWCAWVAFSPDGQRLAAEGLRTTAGDSQVRIWNTATWQLEDTWNTPRGFAHGLEFTADGRLLACICTENAAGEYDVSIWNPLTGKKLVDLIGHRQLARLDVSQDGIHGATADLNGVVIIWDSRTGQPLRTIQGDYVSTGVAFSPDGRRIAVSSGLQGEQGSGTIRIWDVATGREELNFTGHAAKTLVFHPTENRLVTGGTIDQSVKIWDTLSGQEILTLRGHTDYLSTVLFSRDGQRLISASEDRTVRLWDAALPEEGDRRPSQVFTLKHDNGVQALAYHPHQPQLATACSDGTLRFWNTQTGRELTDRRVQVADIVSLSFSPDGKRLAAGAIVLDLATGKQLLKLQRNNENKVLAFSPDGKRLATGDAFGAMSIRDASSGESLYDLEGHGYFVIELAFSPNENGRLLASAGASGNVRVWDTTTGHQIDASLLKHQGAAVGVAFTPDGRWLASCGWDRTVRLWNTETWQPGSLHSTSAGVSCVAICPDARGRLVAWGGTDATVNLWNHTTGEIKTLRGHRSIVLDVTFSPDGKFLASASQDGTARIWEVPE